MNELPIKISQAAIQRIKKILADQGATRLRVGVRAGGCSGLEYVMKAEDQVRDSDAVYELDGIELVIDPKSLKVLEGCELDYTGDLLGSSFKWNNPNAKRGCGCGTSFSLG